MIKTEDGAWLTVTEATVALRGQRSRSTIHRWIDKEVVRSRIYGGERQVWGADVMKAVKVVTRGRPAASRKADEVAALQRIATLETRLAELEVTIDGLKQRD